MKKNLIKIFIAALVILVLAQIPLIYRRYQVAQVSQKIAELNTQRTDQKNEFYNEYKGVIHIHSSLGGHSTAHFDELIDAANSNDLDFVVMTEHYSDKFDTSALTLNGVYGKTLFVGGQKVDTGDGDRFLLIPGSSLAASYSKMPTQELLAKWHKEEKLAFITYPHRFRSWDSEFDGIEVFSLHTGAKQASRFWAVADLLWSFSAYPEITFARHFTRPYDNLARFDEVAMRRPISLFAGTDAHSNIGFHLLGDDAGNKLINIKIDPFETTLKIARAHILIDKETEFDQPALLDALSKGRFFVGIDVFGDSSGFSFTAISDSERKTMGEIVLLESAPVFEIKAPVAARFVILHNGQIVAEQSGKTEMTFIPDSIGTYRVEVYQDALGEPYSSFPWILSNPIYLR